MQTEQPEAEVLTGLGFISNPAPMTVTKICGPPSHENTNR